MSNTSLTPRLILEIQGGCVVDATSDSPVELFILDRDIPPSPGSSILIDDKEVGFYEVNVDVDDDIVQAICHDIEEAQSAETPGDAEDPTA